MQSHHQVRTRLGATDAFPLPFTKMKPEKVGHLSLTPFPRTAQRSHGPTTPLTPLKNPHICSQPTPLNPSQPLSTLLHSLLNRIRASLTSRTSMRPRKRPVPSLSREMTHRCNFWGCGGRGMATQLSAQRAVRLEIVPQGKRAKRGRLRVRSSPGS